MLFGSKFPTTFIPHLKEINIKIGGKIKYVSYIGLIFIIIIFFKIFLCYNAKQQKKSHSHLCNSPIHTVVGVYYFCVVLRASRDTPDFSLFFFSTSPIFYYSNEFSYYNIVELFVFFLVLFVGDYESGFHCFDEKTWLFRFFFFYIGNIWGRNWKVI